MRITQIESRLPAYQPALLDLDGNRHAAVAMLIRPAPAGLQVLFIQRSRNDSDPWSGQMAFPGGMVETWDASAKAAAERETLEEVSIDLTATVFVGRLDDVQGRHRNHQGGIVVSGFVYIDHHGQAAVPNHEVADIVWEPLATFTDRRRCCFVEYPAAPGERFPGIRVGTTGRQVVWGLTRRFMMSFLEVAGEASPAESAPSQQPEKETD